MKSKERDICSSAICQLIALYVCPVLTVPGVGSRIVKLSLNNVTGSHTIRPTTRYPLCVEKEWFSDLALEIFVDSAC